MSRWLPGRQRTGYRKLRLGQGKRWDAWLLDYPPGTGIPEHEDPLEGKRHLRANLTLLSGGTRLDCVAPLFKIGRLTVFWSDRLHSVAKGPGRRLVLSIGVAV